MKCNCHVVAQCRQQDNAKYGPVISLRFGKMRVQQRVKSRFGIDPLAFLDELAISNGVSRSRIISRLTCAMIDILDKKQIGECSEEELLILKYAKFYEKLIFSFLSELGPEIQLYLLHEIRRHRIQ